MRPGTLAEQSVQIVPLELPAPLAIPKGVALYNA
jgi:hypothetical protein